MAHRACRIWGDFHVGSSWHAWEEPKTEAMPRRKELVPPLQVQVQFRIKTDRWSVQKINQVRPGQTSLAARCRWPISDSSWFFCSAPFILNLVADVVEWILLNKHDLSELEHLTFKLMISWQPALTFFTAVVPKKPAIWLKGQQTHDCRAISSRGWRWLNRGKVLKMGEGNYNLAKCYCKQQCQPE